MWQVPGQARSGWASSRKEQTLSVWKEILKHILTAGHVSCPKDTHGSAWSQGGSRGLSGETEVTDHIDQFSILVTNMEKVDLKEGGCVWIPTF